VGRATAQRAAQWEQGGNLLPAEIVAHLLALETATQLLGLSCGRLGKVSSEELCARLELPALAAEPLACAVVGWHIAFERLFSSVLRFFCEERDATHQAARERLLAPYLRRVAWEGQRSAPNTARIASEARPAGGPLLAR
jgi:hypothetical protein